MNIESKCKRYDIKNYTVNDDGTIDVAEDIYISYKGLTELPLRFNKVSGNFDCSNNQLTSLKGNPRWIGGYFNCTNNRLTSLEFSPEFVGTDFYWVYNDLIDNYCDTEITGRFYSNKKQEGLIFSKFEATNYNQWRKLYKRKKILDQIFKILFIVNFLLINF